MKAEQKKEQTFVIRINNGYHFEYHETVKAVSIHAARKEFMRMNAGMWYAEPKNFRVSSK